jgi:hypothetical protein
MPPETKHARSGDVYIAYQVVGEGPLDLVFIPGFVSHVEANWQSPGRAKFQRQLGYASIQTTPDRDGHLMPDAHAVEARKLDRLVFGENGRDGAGRVAAEAVQRLQNGSRDDEGVSENAR